MLNFGLLAFAQPWLLLALAGLPLLWLLLRLTPPAPRRLTFPAVRLLAGLKVPEETPARTPWWLLLLRLFIVALIILGLAQPLLNPAAQLSGSGPMMLVIDDGWASARFWPARQIAAANLLAQAEREDRPVILLTTAPGTQDTPPETSGLLPAAEARRLLQGLKPKPWPVDREAAQAAVEDLRIDGTAHVVWLSDGLDAPGSAGFAAALQRLGRLHVLREESAGLAHLALAPDTEGVDLVARALRADGQGASQAAVLAIGGDGRIITRAPLLFEPGETEARALLDLPTEMRNRIALLSIEGETTAGATVLLDERWRRRPVGLVSIGGEQEAQPLLSETYYLQSALEPFTELRKGSVEDLLQRQLAVLALPDSITLSPDERGRIADWVSRGGLLLRFAGPHSVAQPPAGGAAAGGGDDLLPVRLRGGDRILGGALTWDTPARLAPFAADSPFADLALPDDVVIRRQVLAEPSLDLGEKTWARLSDGTPLVTADRRGEGWLVLFHTTANTDWSNLPISGLFVEMLRRVMAISQGVEGGSGGAALPPIEVMDGFGSLGAPPATVLALETGGEAGGGRESPLGPRHPPGYYGNDSLRQAHNLSRFVGELTPLRGLPAGVTTALYQDSPEQDLKPWLLAAALFLALLDLLISLALRGLLRPGGGVAAASATGALLLGLGLGAAGLAPAAPALAQARDDGRTLEATLMTRLAYVETGDPAVDEISRAGLMGLTRVLERRTSVEAGPPLGIVLGRDDMAFFPLVYWPVTASQPAPSQAAIDQVNFFLDHGGTILFDLRESSAGAQIFGGGSQGTQHLRRLTQGIAIPPLEPVPVDHVLRKAFYLMEDFPGRFVGGTLWLEAPGENVNDGVASILIGSNDWAGAWAVNELGRPLNAVVPGGPRQREMAYRFGINLVMYALTGNYKADQVHIPFILERLGQ
ncbi:DUF4159 domain-containing protein [Pelagibius sp. CAU 1746]|uniref:DUF4159 domain-containing protein n=1 Tax=Pelagibius sp. CAU 1746 TaxID=3140370 RepID=UPI00325BB18E